MNQIKFSGGIIEKCDDVILRITFNNENEITLNDIKEITNVRTQLFGEKEYCSLIDARKDFVSFSEGATKYVASDPTINRLRIAEAVLVKNMGQSLGGTLYKRLFRPKSEMKFFYNEEKALDWLKEQYEKWHLSKNSDER